MLNWNNYDECITTHCLRNNLSEGAFKYTSEVSQGEKRTLVTIKASTQKKFPLKEEIYSIPEDKVYENA